MLDQIIIECNHEGGFPLWAHEAFSLFTNKFGEQWIAAWRGADLVVSGGDIDWGEIIVTNAVLRRYKKNSALPAVLAQKIFNDEETHWVLGVLLVGSALADAKKGNKR